MSDLLPPARKLRISQAPGNVTKAALGKVEQLIIVVPHRVPAGLWSKLPDGSRLHNRARRQPADATVRMHLPNSAATGIVLGRLPRVGKTGVGKTGARRSGAGLAGASAAQTLAAFDRLRFAGKLVAEALVDSPKNLGLLIVGVPDDEAALLAQAFTLATIAHAHRLPTWFSKPSKQRPLGTLRILGLPARIDVDRAKIEGDAINLARWLTVMPANKLSAAGYHDVLKTLAKNHRWQLEFLGEARLAKLGAGAFLAVSQGNATRDAGIVRLRYRPAGSGRRAPLALVGKGIIFDTGGNNVKSFKSMLDMHEDMGGSAVAIATLQALTRIGYREPVDCWLAITENRIGSRAYKSRDVVTASNGTTIEVIHTDAEGRMVLADTLALAGRERPDVILDFATLTGTCWQALTDRYSGVFTNRAALNPLLIDTGTLTGERVWPFPMDADYEEELKSKVADILQCSPGDEGDHILAARFLQRFVPDSAAWVHMDLSAVTRKDGLAQVPSGATGFGVRYTLGLLLDQADEFKRLAGQ
jgi:leucyl aminopeptidase